MLAPQSTSSAHPSAAKIPTPTTATPTASPMSANVDCNKASPIQPGTTQNQVVSAHPQASRGEHTRSYLVHLPSSYTGKTALPVVIVFHGHGGDAANAEQSTGFSQLADSEQFLAVYPQGLLDDDHLPFWASIGPLDYNIDETLFMNDMLNKLEHDFCVDTQRIYATGFSNGGGMSGFVACKLAHRIAAVAPIAGNYYDVQGGCKPGRPVPILEIHGSQDPIVPYNGISPETNPQWPLPSVHDWLQAWATRNGCTKGPQQFFQDSDTTGLQWTNCQQNATVMHYRIEGGGHSIPATIGKQPTSLVIWNFFKAHPMPQKTT
ncbi:alpha/beta hydrolase family esterase [Ktedonosporobacter rubrisoli]|nr:PHB depolymerase family esterase [Ktedonosporobacter rubrisoli]